MVSIAPEDIHLRRVVASTRGSVAIVEFVVNTITSAFGVNPTVNSLILDCMMTTI